MTTLTDALQSALAAEEAVIYGYGVAGAHLAGKQRADARAALGRHLSRRDRLIALIRATGATPVAALPAYQLPFPVTDATSAKRLAFQVEESAAGAAWDLITVSAAGGAVRALGSNWLVDAAETMTHWSGAVPALPGQPS